MPERCPECNLLGGHLAGCSHAGGPSARTGPYRHGCLTAWLIGMVVLNAIAAASFPISLSSPHPVIPRLTLFMAGLAMSCAILNIVFAVALLRWRRWGFYGFACTSIVAFAMNIYLGTSPASTMLGLGGVVLLAILLNVGGDQKAWRYLK